MEYTPLYTTHMIYICTHRHNINKYHIKDHTFHMDNKHYIHINV